ncbi:hypothetical protein F441_13405 [Phytophthora nicotianae CJ01A1]|uniref:Uncharacterized protein n=4 Tax=Phytophthora nicotianae TaxID=4792 RepID=V9ET94_PHYNI|nr:hypothetical protein F443_13470 [Phytophthora nicotianae P1569]ETL34766.1 hypothetical protein L916_13049 [Phytophthora nicotianae]ETP11054.1 hypothetical protein F441_13405 [Phytophthora nicotianae CJ01A1]
MGLIVTGDDMLRLDEALAFIAFCDERIHDPVSADNLHGTRASILLEEIDDLLDPEVQGSVSAESIKTSSTSHNLSLIGIPSVTPARQKKRVRSAGSSSAVLQRRKKAEIESLREESKTLETYLSHLRRTGGPEKAMAITNGDELRSEWQRHAFIQYQQRYASEQTNRHLKELMSKQQRLSRKLRRNLFKRNALDGIEFVRTLESPTFDEAPFIVKGSNVLMRQVEDEVNNIYCDFNRICQPVEDRSSSEVTYGEKCKANIMEFTTTTPLSWPMTSAFTHVWNMLESSLDRSRNPNTLERRVNLTIPIGNGTSCHFHKLHFLHKYEEEDRIIVIWSDLMQMTTRTVKLRSLAYVVFTPSKNDPSQAEDIVSQQDIRFGREVLLGAFARLMRTFWQDQQNRLLEVTSRSHM